jgi:AraC family transcriptional regulator, activator of mtrCDE
MDRFRALMSCIRDELDRNDAGAMAIATDLASAMFMMMLRQHLASHPPVEGLLTLLGQRATAKAVIAMLHDPSYEWTLDELAARAVVSRATLIRAFGRISGAAPLTFLTELRLALARRQLATTRDQSAKSLPISAISPKQLSVARSIAASGLGRANFASTARTAKHHAETRH